MRIDQTDFVLTDGELAALTAGIEANELGMRARSAPAPMAEAPPSELADLVTALVQPAKTARFHYSIAAESLTRGFLAWSAEGDVVSVTASGTSRRIGRRSPTELAVLTAAVLGDPGSVRPAPLSLSVSSTAVLVWLAVVEHRLETRLAGMLDHYAPERLLHRRDVARRLAESVLEDFRWPLMFFAKVLPVDLPAAVRSDEIDAALDELGSLDLVESVGGVDLLELTEKGMWLAEEMTGEVSKVGIGVSAFRRDGRVGHETQLLVRTPRHLLLHDLGGVQAVVAALSGSELDTLLEHTFRPPESAESRFCPSCGEPAGAEFRFCPSCGRPLL